MKTQPKNQFLKEQEELLTKLLGTSTKILQKKNGNGEIRINFNSLEEFERIINNLK
ncbi:hypothetical protein [Streptococcus suis]|uniref:hypothetical protein n=1 Tax=Streptococcus suis TaxID=1307 RepID=UPI003AF80571